MAGCLADGAANGEPVVGGGREATSPIDWQCELSHPIVGVRGCRLRLQAD